MPNASRPIDIEVVYAQALACYPEELPVEDRQRLRADLQLQIDYPGEYVAYIDLWEGDASRRRLARRVVAHGPSLDDIQPALIEHRENGAAVCYADDPDDDSVDRLPEEVL
ncbi:MAG TPA: hypothetical protein VKA46_17075 [Gemmataceae bacterium]|nr:hypothetical protein [Gemmataceae bacterium]